MSPRSKSRGTQTDMSVEYFKTSKPYPLLDGEFTLALSFLLCRLGAITSRLHGKVIDVDAALGQELLHV